jgi:hypothetical protein
MTDPGKKLREEVYRRDGYRCVVCGSPNITFQHRQASGQGGRGSKAPKLTAADGLSACLLDNQAFEADLQTRAIANGWKVKRFTPVPAAEVPVWYRVEQQWYLLNPDGSRDPLTEEQASEYRVLAGTLEVIYAPNSLSEANVFPLAEREIAHGQGEIGLDWALDGRR